MFFFCFILQLSSPNFLPPIHAVLCFALNLKERGCGRPLTLTLQLSLPAHLTVSN